MTILSTFTLSPSDLRKEARTIWGKQFDGAVEGHGAKSEYADANRVKMADQRRMKGWHWGPSRNQARPVEAQPSSVPPAVHTDDAAGCMASPLACSCSPHFLSMPVWFPSPREDAGMHLAPGGKHSTSPGADFSSGEP